MNLESSDLAATLHALCGESDLRVIAPAFSNRRFARMLALAPGVNVVVSALGALVDGLPDLLTPAVRASPALSAAIASLIGTDAGHHILGSWANVAPAGWGAAHAAALIDAVRHDRCARWAAAALMGPTSDAAALLYAAQDIALAIRRWGQTTPDDPTAWMNTLPLAERDRLLDALYHAPDDAAICLPWLPKAGAANIVDRSDRAYLSLAIDAYVAASPIARAHHVGVLSTLFQRAERYDLAKLTRLAVASRMDAAWAAVVQILREAPNDAGRVVVVAPWDDVRPDVQDIILSAADNDSTSICAAIAFARGVRKRPPPTTGTTARAFFAAVTPKVWNALPMEMQRVWCTQLAAWHMPLAVRSLGPDPTFLARAYLNADVIAAVRCHFHDDSDLRHTLLPVAVRDLPLIAVPDIVGALLPPPDPVAFVQIVCGEREMPPALHDWITAHPTPHAYGTAATILRAVEQSDAIAARCAALAQALADWSWEETDALLAALPDDTHAALHPNADALTAALAHPDRRDAFRQALDALAALPPAAALPASHALTVLMQATNPLVQQGAGEGLAQALRDHGRIFADIARTLDDVARDAVLPRWDDPHDESALEDLAAVDPLVAHYVAHALRDGNAAVVLDALADSSLEKTLHLWRLLPDTIRSAILGDGDALLTDVAAPGRADALAQTLQAWNADDPLALLALRMLIENDEARRARGAAILAQQPDLSASLLLLLREDLRAVLVRDPRIAVAGADLPPPSSPAPAPMLPRRRRRSR